MGFGIALRVLAGCSAEGAAESGAASTAQPVVDHTAHAGIGPAVDASALPTGDPGSATRDLGKSSEKPSAGDGIGAFRTTCSLSHMKFDDPIVFPGQPGAAHLHAFFGNTAVNASSTQDSIENTGNSTCRGGIVNRSSYWVPALLDARGKPVEPVAMDVYYKSGYGGIAPSQIQKFPSGLRVVAGSAKASAQQDHAYWGCRARYIGRKGTPPKCDKDDHVTMFVDFPQCWDGKNLDSADHISHMAYPQRGKCPSTHPVAIPQLTFNVVYDPVDMTGWRLASDMYSSTLPGGFSAHGDWFEGWEPAISETFINDCVRKGVDCHSHLLGDGRTIE